MLKKTPHIADQRINIVEQKDVKGYIKEFDGESFYCIENYDRMDPFFMTIVSSSDLWMFISSKGGLTAGRENYDNALFPYYTDDKIHDTSEITGPGTIIRVIDKDKLFVWEPFSKNYQDLYKVQRNLYKNTGSNKIIFQEINYDLQLSFSYTWMSCDKLGWIRKSKIENFGENPRDFDITDGLKNVLPYGVTKETQESMSTLMDAYKIGELISGTNLALIRMSSIPVDKAEPSEALRANTVWSHGIKVDKVLLSSEQIEKIRAGEDFHSEEWIYGVKTAFFIHSKEKIKPHDQKSWYIIADTSKDSSQIISLKNFIHNEKDISSFIESNVKADSEKLNTFVELSDGIQNTGDELNDRRHFSNVLFNIMRGGVFENSYEIDLEDFFAHLKTYNRETYKRSLRLFDDNKDHISLHDLHKIALKSNDSDLLRLSLEYLPLSFSRRHGDPSRPWNRFDIHVKNPDGTSLLYYQGNWRDIFQNWEALSFSFPGFLPGMICRFLNASTVDGYNPFRITKNGFDWEVQDPDDPWSFIGYWCDHQIIYLLKLLELHEKFFPGQLFEKFNKRFYVYANVPYRIKNYNEIVANPQDTIVFDHDLHEKLISLGKQIGSDGKLLWLNEKKIVKATFKEKILVTLLTKLSNFVPEAGIWLNTQRPEWNDANNALVGNGASMVTLYHLRRFVSFFIDIVNKSENEKFAVSEEVYVFWKNINNVLKNNESILDKGFTDNSRRDFTDLLGNIGQEYRNTVYKGFSGKERSITKTEIIDFYRLAIKYLDQSIYVNRRDDGLYHSYNLLEFNNNSIQIKQLYLMLEGQVAVLNSGICDPKETLFIVKSLFDSDLWRNDQQSFLLYPFRQAPGFLEINVIPAELVEGSSLLQKLIAKGNTRVIKQDDEGQFHFNAEFKNKRDLEHALENLPNEFDREFIKSESPFIFDIYEAVFQHRYFTGRSGSFYKYEGLGSIYWHMVSKLLLAIGDNIMSFERSEGKSPHLSKLKDYYYKVKEGIGLHKNPQKYGAFPTDPYSHTPSMLGVQQPGMTGQVKEDILSRFNELGVIIEDGCIKIDTTLLQNNEFDSSGTPQLSFLYCNTPFYIKKSKNQKGLEVVIDGEVKKETDTNVSRELSEEIFMRTGRVTGVTVNV